MLHKANVLPRHPKHDCYTGEVVNWRTAVIHYVAKAVGLLVKVEGMPLGTNRNIERGELDEGGTVYAVSGGRMYRMKAGA